MRSDKLLDVQGSEEWCCQNLLCHLGTNWKHCSGTLSILYRVNSVVNCNCDVFQCIGYAKNNIAGVARWQCHHPDVCPGVAGW